MNQTRRKRAREREEEATGGACDGDSSSAKEAWDRRQTEGGAEDWVKQMAELNLNSCYH